MLAIRSAAPVTITPILRSTGRGSRSCNSRCSPSSLNPSTTKPYNGQVLYAQQVLTLWSHAYDLGLSDTQIARLTGTHPLLDLQKVRLESRRVRCNTGEEHVAPTAALWAHTCHLERWSARLLASALQRWLLPDYRIGVRLNPELAPLRLGRCRS